MAFRWPLHQEALALPVFAFFAKVCLGLVPLLVAAVFDAVVAVRMD